jgi:tRNA A-37 threonylcarbamoyl transferase component Bud32
VLSSRAVVALTASRWFRKVARVIQRETAGVRWELQPEFAPVLDEVLKSPGEMVKESPVKQVTRHRFGAETFYVKRYLHHAVPARPLKFFFKPSQARQEWKLAQQLEARDIPVVRHLGLGERVTWRGVQESILVTAGFDGTEMSQTAEVDPQVVLRFVEQMHERGVVQEDLHLANILVRREPFELRLVDLHGTLVRSRLSAGDRAKNLALLGVFLPIKLSPQIEELSRGLRQSMLRERSRRCLRQNREFARQAYGGLQWQLRLPLNEEATRILAGPDEFLERRATLLKRGRSATVGSGDGFVLKRFNLRRPIRLIKDLFRRSPAMGAFHKAYHLELLGIATARPIAAAERRVFRFLTRSYFLTQEIPGAVSLAERLKRGANLDDRIIERLGELIGRLHREGFSHRDLKTNNILFDATGQPHLIDLDGLAYFQKIPDSRAAADLKRLVRGVQQFGPVTHRHWFIFLRVYCRTRQIRRIPRG